VAAPAASPSVEASPGGEATPPASPSPEVSPAGAPAPEASPVASPSPEASPVGSPSPEASPAGSPSPEAAPGPEAPPSLPSLPGGETPAIPGINGGGTQPAEEGLIVKSIDVEGNNVVPSADILNVVTSRIGETADKNKIQRDLQNIYELGFFTDVKVRTVPYLNGVKIIYRVLENPTVKSIAITGNKIVPSEKIRSLMETHEGKILNTKTLFADITVINRYYDNELGYLLEPTHVTTLKFTPEGNLQMGITEGVPVREIKISGNSAVPTKQIMPLIKMRPGQLFNQFTMKDDSERIARLYEKKDYILDNIKPSINKAEGVVTYNVIEAKVEEIRVEGNTRTRAYVIKRLMRTRVGAVLKRTRLQHDIERLNSSGYFETVNVEPEPGTEPGRVIIVLKVKEQKTGLATLGLGYSGGGTGALQSGLTGAVSFSERNYQGTGRSGSISWQRGVNIQSYGLSLFDPVINNSQDSIGISFYHSEFDQLRQPVVVAGGVTSNYAIYNDHRTGVSFSYGHYLSDDVRAFVTVKHEDLEITQASNSAFTAVGLGTGVSNSVAINFLTDTRDDLFNPHQGTYGNIGAAASGGLLGGQFAFTKMQFEYRKYIPLKSNTLAMRFWAGVANGDLPVSEIFFLGGSDTLRAYNDNSFIGNRFVLANVEYRFPIAKLKLLNGAVFTDLGDAWYSGQPFHLYKDVGVGLRLVFPSLGLGVIRLDYSFGERGSRSTIGLGQSF
jgi:outer membrane protein insertion porin family